MFFSAGTRLFICFHYSPVRKVGRNVREQCRTACVRAAKEKLDSWFPSSVWLIPARQRTGDTRRLLVKAEWIFHIKTFEFIFVDILKTSIYYLLLFSALHLHNRLFCIFCFFHILKWF